MRLEDGRQLGFSAWGRSVGKPVVLLHGLPGSRLCARALNGVADEMGLKLITPERPGFGISTLQTPRAISNWAADLEELADLLGLASFPLIGVSGGAPFALACAARLGRRLESVTIVSGLGPLSDPCATVGMAPLFRFFWHAARRHSQLIATLLKLYCPLLRRFPMQLFFNSLDADSRRILAHDARVQRGLVEDVREALRQGTRPFAIEASILARPWDFRLEEIDLPAHVWHGTSDHICPAEMAYRMADSLTLPRVHIRHGEGHLMAFRHIGEILGSLC